MEYFVPLAEMKLHKLPEVNWRLKPRKFKENMAPSKQVIQSVVASISAVVSLVTQMFGLILIWGMNVSRQNNAIITMIARKRNYFREKLARRRLNILNRRPRSCWFKKGRTDLWWENMWNGIAPEECWKKNFRMPRESFMNLLAELNPYISPDLSSPNYRALSAEKKLALTLYFLKDTGSLGMTANTFGIAINTASAVITEVCQVISRKMGPKYIHLPRSQESMRRKVSEFEAKFGMNQAFGCVDGTHIPIKCPAENSQDFFCYKQYHSLSVQAVCDYRGCFLDVECMWPGSVHDAKVFTNSSINIKLRDNKLPTTYQTLVEGRAKVPNYLIGDPAYPLLPFCMKEYKTCTSNEEVIFNNILRAARNPIECAFGRLKARWAILTRKMNFKLETIPKVVYACFVLHNYCEKNNVNVDQTVVNSQIEFIRRNEAEFQNNPDPIYSSNEEEGIVVRKTLTKLVLDTLM
jgi:hypothetical protein